MIAEYLLISLYTYKSYNNKTSNIVGSILEKSYCLLFCFETFTLLGQQAEKISLCEGNRFQLISSHDN